MTKPTQDELAALLKPMVFKKTIQHFNLQLTRTQLKVVLEALNVAKEEARSPAGKAMYTRARRAVVDQIGEEIL